MRAMRQDPSAPSPDSPIDGPYAWWRLAVSLVIAMTGGAGLWSVVVVLPRVEVEFGADRAEASLPYALTMLGFALGGILMGRMVDRYGITRPLAAGALAIAAGYALTAQASSITEFTLLHGLLIGMLGCSVSFGPLVADVTHWFDRHRGLAVAIAASGSYLAGTIWPPVVEALIDQVGWRDTHRIVAVVCLAVILPLSLFLRRRPPEYAPASRARTVGPNRTGSQPATADFAISGGKLQGLLILAGLGCCIAMAMPQVHIVAFCLELGFDSARGAEMLSLMLATGIVSRLAFGIVADRIGPLPTLLLGSGLQALALLLFLPFEGLVSLYIVSGLFGLSQGGIVPTYALIVRKIYPASEAGTRVSLVLAATLIGMGLGGWMSGVLYDLTLSYDAAFLNGVAWNILNMAIAAFLLWRLGSLHAAAPRPAAA